MPNSEAGKEALRWIAHARRDWHDAQILATNDLASSNVIWLVQQAVEKSNKAVLIRDSVVFRKIHDLEELVQLLPAKHALSELTRQLAILSNRAMESRYPGEFDPINSEDGELALEIGQLVFEIMQDEFQVTGPETHC